ncbi:hypothetical protein LCL86_02465 [Muricauda ruestringensis]|nr:hypothetical protein [Allomuricauda ruestringensis]
MSFADGHVKTYLFN